MLKRFLFHFLFCGLANVALSQIREGESNLKAAFIYNFTKYIDWGKSNTEKEFVIGIIGTSPISTPLTEIALSKTVNNKEIVIRYFEKPEDITYCHILFIPKKISFSLNSILEAADKGTITISEAPGLAERGTAFNFVIVNDKLKFEINMKSIYQTGLRVSSQLLKLAIIVN